MTYPPPPGTPDPYNSPPDPTPQDPFAGQPSNPYAQQPVSPPQPPPLPPSSSPPYAQTSTPPYGQQQSYGAPYAQQPYGYAPTTPPQNSMALTAMILALVGIATWITAPVGAILGHIALKQIRQTGESGEGMAKTGIIVGWIITGIGVLCCVGYVVTIVFAIGSGGGFN